MRNNTSLKHVANILNAYTMTGLKSSVNNLKTAIKDILAIVLDKNEHYLDDIGGDKKNGRTIRVEGSDHLGQMVRTFAIHGPNLLRTSRYR